MRAKLTQRWRKIKPGEEKGGLYLKVGTLSLALTCSLSPLRVPRSLISQVLVMSSVSMSVSPPGPRVNCALVCMFSVLFWQSYSQCSVLLTPMPLYLYSPQLFSLCVSTSFVTPCGFLVRVFLCLLSGCMFVLCHVPCSPCPRFTFSFPNVVYC